MSEITLQDCVCTCQNVVEAIPEESSGFKKGLEIGLIVIVIILILIGLKIGLSKIRKNDDDDDGEHRYY